MNLQRMIQVMIGLVACLLLTVSGTSKAQSPYIYTGYSGAYPFGWGYFGYTTWPQGYWNYPYSYGFDYGPYYYYVPTYGALTWSATQEVGGFSWGQDSIAAASSVAQSACAASDCQPVVWVSNGCAAISTSPTNKRLGWAYANTKLDAISAARRACASSGGLNCLPKGWVCSF